MRIPVTHVLTQFMFNDGKENDCQALPFLRHNKIHIHNDAQAAVHVSRGIIAIIGERERANLVVQLARFFYIHLYIYPGIAHTVMFYIRTSKYALHEKTHAHCARVFYLSGQKAIFCLALAVVHIYIHGFGVPLALLLWYIHPWIRSAP